MTLNQKLKWLRKYDYEVDKLTGCAQVTWQAWDTLDSDGYRIVMPTKNQAINEAYSFLSDKILGDYYDLLDCIEVAAKTGNWGNYDIFMDKLKAMIAKGV